MANTNLTKAKREKNDEFYTQLVDIEKELQHYTEHFKDKVVYCNCDSPDSNFVKYFNENKERLGIKEFYHSWYNMETGEGSFNSPESIELLEKADIIVTNPPFSLFREFIALMELYQKKYLVIGNMNAITYKETFKLIKGRKLWVGVNFNKTVEFRLDNTYEKHNRIDESGNKYGNVPAICWFTNLSHNKRNERLFLYKEYNETEYPKYDNYDAIEVSKTKDIPKNYNGVMGVPITFLDKYNPEQFEILGLDNHLLNEGSGNGCNSINGKKIYRRLIIRRK